MTLEEINTPALVLDLDRVENNCQRMICRAKELGVALRPHMKTAKSAEIARIATREQSVGITVSTLAEAEYFAKVGFDDITYAVGVSPQKIAILAALQRRYKARIALLTDSVQAIREVSKRCDEENENFSMFIEIDCGGGRGGLPPAGSEILQVAQIIGNSRSLSLAGVLTHGGHSYLAENLSQIAEIAEQERRCVIEAAEHLRSAGIAVPAVSVGSTPTALCAKSLEGVTDMRPGVYTSFDLDQVGLGICKIEDIAITVLATVIGRNPRSERIIIDAGALALSKDLSGNKHFQRTGYGLVGLVAGDLPKSRTYVAEVHQEHGLIAGDCSFDTLMANFPIGARVRILPNHACMTAAAYDRYHVTRGVDTTVLDVWSKASRWTPELPAVWP